MEIKKLSLKRKKNMWHKKFFLKYASLINCRSNLNHILDIINILNVSTVSK